MRIRLDRLQLPTKSKRLKLAIFGDSFGVNDSFGDNIGWTTLLSQIHQIDNFCQSGVGEYKILRSIQKCNLSKYDALIVTHTSPMRVHTLTNPLHQNTKHHKNCDIIFSDIEHRTDEFSTMAKQYFKFSFDTEYYVDVHNLICQQIHNYTKPFTTVHVTHFDYNGLYNFDNALINMYTQWVNNKGSVNHYSKQGNQLVFEYMSNLLNQL